MAKTVFRAFTRTQPHPTSPHGFQHMFTYAPLPLSDVNAERRGEGVEDHFNTPFNIRRGMIAPARPCLDFISFSFVRFYSTQPKDGKINPFFWGLMKNRS